MATAKKSSSLKEFNTTIKINNLQVGVNVTAASMEEAVEIARKFSVSDVISFDGNDHIDSEGTELVGVYASS